MSNICYETAETAMLILEQISTTDWDKTERVCHLMNNREAFGISHERDVIIDHAAPCLNSAYNKGGDLNSSCFDMEIIESVIDFINLYEEGLQVDQIVWDKAYNFAYCIHEKGMTQEQAFAEVGFNREVK